MSRHRIACSSKRRCVVGFSFIELLVVLAIISVLMGGLVVAIGIWFDRRQEHETRSTMQKACMTVEAWKLAYDVYPPSAMTRMAAVVDATTKVRQPDNDTNDAIETVYQALHWPGFRGNCDWAGSEVGNTDGDTLPEGLHGHAPVALLEFLDAYGNPLVYFHRDDYLRFAEDGARYVSGSRVVEPRPYRDERGAFVNPSSFQVFSMGPDGEPNTDDDILAWDR